MITESAPLGELTPMEQAVAEEPRRRQITFGLPCGLQHGERRFPLTPEGAGLLVDSGVRVKIQRGAGDPIHYSDAAYERAGADL
ncbi:MAG: alanine dehydrogenase, partial [Muribaculaceae bacterium]|nr:alanine dehydrogenase [Muribaculaceae bacterium]